MSALTFAYTCLDVPSTKPCSVRGQQQQLGLEQKRENQMPRSGSFGLSAAKSSPRGFEHTSRDCIREESDLNEDAIDSSQPIVRGSRRASMGKRRKLIMHNPHPHPHAYARVTGEAKAVFVLFVAASGQDRQLLEIPRGKPTPGFSEIKRRLWSRF